MIRLLLLACLFAIFPAHSTAQDHDLDTFTWFPASITFDYPAEWVVRDDLYTYGTISLSTSLEAIDSTPIPEGEILMQLTPAISTHPDNVGRLGLTDLNPEIVLNQMQRVTTTRPEIREIDGREVAIVTTTANDMAFLIVATHYQEDLIALAYAVTSGDSIDSYYDVVMGVILSVRPADLPASNHEVTEIQAPPTGEFDGTKWILQGDLETYAPDAFRGMFGRLDVTQEEIFVATGSHNLLVVTFDGVLDRVIANDLIYFHDVAVDDDGTIWVLDRTNLKVWHITASGEVLGGFGSYGDGVTQFTAYGGADIALDDDYIYVLTTKPFLSYVLEDVQVWRRDGEFVRVIVSLPRDAGLRDSSLLYVNDQNIYVTAGGDYIYSAYDKDGTLQYHQPPFLELSYPGAFTFNEQDNLFFFETLGMIYRYNYALNRIEAFGFSATERTGEIPSGELFYPRGLGVLPDGDLIIADANETHWQVLRVSTGAIVDEVSPE
jgi:hypothetical protein